MGNRLIEQVIGNEISHYAKMTVAFFAGSSLAMAGFIYFIWRNYIQRSTGVCVIAFFVFGWLAIMSLLEMLALRRLRRGTAITNPEEIVAVYLAYKVKKAWISIQDDGLVPADVSSMKVRFSLRNGRDEQYEFRSKFISDLLQAMRDMYTTLPQLR